MPTAVNKQKLLSQLFTSLKRSEPEKEPEPLPVLEQFIYGLCREGVTRELADRAFRRLRETFFDWNEIRVSSAHEVEEILVELPDAAVRAERLVSFLQEVFETTFSFDLEPMHKKGLKQAGKALTRFEAANDYVAAWVIQKSLNGHAIPLDGPALRTLRRLGLIESDQEDLEATRASLEHLVPKAKGSVFLELISELASENCWEDTPSCHTCPLQGECTTGQECLGGETVGAARTVRAKPR